MYPRHSDSLLLPGQHRTLCAGLAVSAPRSAWLRHNVPDLRRPTSRCHSPESYLKKAQPHTYSHLFFFPSFSKENKDNKPQPNLSSSIWIDSTLPSHRAPHPSLRSTLHNTSQKCFLSILAFYPSHRSWATSPHLPSPSTF